MNAEIARALMNERVRDIQTEVSNDRRWRRVRRVRRTAPRFPMPRFA